MVTDATTTTTTMTRPLAPHPVLDTSQKRTLLLPNHTAAALAHPTITHTQLRHLLACPQRRGVLYYPSDYYIVEHDILKPQAIPRRIIELVFRATCFSATAVQSPTPSSSNSHANSYVLFAAGGSESQLHISLHAFPPAPSTSTSYFAPPPKPLWKHTTRLPGPNTNIVNYILFTPASLTDKRKSDTDVRVVVCGNDMAVRVFDVVMGEGVREEARVTECGFVKLETCINHVSISPSGTTLLCVGDTPKIYLYTISPGATVTFYPLVTYTFPPPPPVLTSATLHPHTPSLTCFTTAWSPDGLKFAAASQEGQLCVWDVRSSTPVFTFWTPLRPLPGQRRARMAEWEWEDLGGRGVGVGVGAGGVESGVRGVRFSGGETGRELLVWVEHTNNLHVIDARTFSLATHAIVPFPDLGYLKSNSSGGPAHASGRPAEPCTTPSASTSLGQPQNARSSSSAPRPTNNNDNASTENDNGSATRAERRVIAFAMRAIAQEREQEQQQHEQASGDAPPARDGGDVDVDSTTNDGLDIWPSAAMTRSEVRDWTRAWLEAESQSVRDGATASSAREGVSAGADSDSGEAWRAASTSLEDMARENWEHQFAVRVLVAEERRRARLEGGNGGEGDDASSTRHGINADTIPPSGATPSLSSPSRAGASQQQRNPTRDRPMYADMQYTLGAAGIRSPEQTRMPSPTRDGPRPTEQGVNRAPARIGEGGDVEGVAEAAVPQGGDGDDAMPGLEDVHDVEETERLAGPRGRLGVSAGDRTESGAGGGGGGEGELAGYRVVYAPDPQETSRQNQYQNQNTQTRSTQVDDPDDFNSMFAAGAREGAQAPTPRPRSHPHSPFPPHLESVAEAQEPSSPAQTQTHIAGLCFDPSGGWVYVAAQGGGIVEWRVREREEGGWGWGGGAWV
ncbi:hypothetical protein K439DRAFT_1665225 [Ramaria rubella]|nr:hypothetical protein K439DRAFT_1665225 [Ramaria rubella]